jgi:3-hydroxymyristoyl/3-hydroxydecanoyl-(acyl carrier protein) dehydratase
MPAPPLLLADRVTDIEGASGVLGRGTVWTETDVRWDSWYLHDGRMPAGLMIESGQADLLLISWMGADFLNRGERVYRLLGCDAVFYGGLPVPGDTLRFDIHIDGHARQGDVRLFFFHYDCHVNGALRLSVRNGQAGFFDDEELASSAGVLWDPADTPPPDGRLDPPAVPAVPSGLTAAQLRAFSEGRLQDAFGAGFEAALTHTRSPRIPSGRLCLLHEVTHIEPQGGPWKRGYLRAVWRVSPDDWFFDGHFKDDPCMPGTLMAEATLQALAVYMSAMGFTLARDGWRFEPVAGEKYTFRCRGQAVPSSRELVYEIFVHELTAGPEPTVYADLLCTVDGLKAFQCGRMGLRLVPDWPLEARPDLLPPRHEPNAVVVGGLPLDSAAMLACAWGRPSKAMGPAFAAADGPRRLPRLPGPPYLLASRVVHLEAETGVIEPGASVEVEYDVPPDAWYFAAHGPAAMPFAVLMEIGLQPCGWLASYVGIPMSAREELFFRNLDGIGTVRPVGPEAGIIRTRARLLNVSRSGGMTIESFEVACRVGDETVLRLTTSFGHFREESLAQQVGLPTTDADRERVALPSDLTLDLATLGGPIAMPSPPLLMIDAITGWWPRAGAAGLGRLRATKTVNADEWFFKAHFFQDPVQPGSLGVDAILQLLRAYAVARGLPSRFREPRLESPARDHPIAWKYRGQVRPWNEVIVLEVEVTAVTETPEAVLVVADGWLWVDGLRIYQVKDLSVRLSEGDR